MRTLMKLYQWDVSSFNLIPSSGGAFEIRVDNRLIFSKLSQGRFPEEDEVIFLLDSEIKRDL
jgi:selenoprotein W-related protein